MTRRPFYVSTAGAARILGLTDRKVRCMARARLIPHAVLPCGELRFNEADLFEWLESLRVKVEREKVGALRPA